MARFSIVFIFYEQFSATYCSFKHIGIIENAPTKCRVVNKKWIVVFFLIINQNLFVLILVALMRVGDALGTEPERPHLREPCGVSQASIARQPEQRNSNQTNDTSSQDINRDGLNRLLRMFTRSHLDTGNIISQLVSKSPFPSVFLAFSVSF